MLKYKTLRWSNCFSYGENNAIHFDKNPITQLVGKNGHGKSSIALILEEVQFNKNSKGIKKVNILNRNCKSKSYSIELDFEKDGDEYCIITSRGSTQKVQLLKNGLDVSSHTATGTFKEIETILGYDHDTFSQIVYQSSTASLAFLTATDTQRKKFLIELLKLDRYGLASEVFKAESSSLSKDLTVVETKVASAKTWIDKYSKENLTLLDTIKVPVEDQQLQADLENVLVTKANLNNINLAVQQNNKYKELRDAIILPSAPTGKITVVELNKLRADIAVLTSEISSSNSQLKPLKNTKTNCPTCGGSLSVNHEHLQQTITTLETLVIDKTTQLKELEQSLKVGIKLQKDIDTHMSALQEFEKYHGLYNESMSSTVLDSTSLEKQYLTIQAEIKAVKLSIQQALEHNTTANKHNAKVDLIKSQLLDMQEELVKDTVTLEKYLKRLSVLQVLVKAFSNTGLVAYKIECLVKDLECITNEYLAEMSDGRFQLGFEISSSDKLNVVITDNGTDIDIAALSSGERARVNIATLLAIRKLMQALSSTKTNLLILDETVESLDVEGKEKLIEVLLTEEELNTVLISHSFTHPLIERIGIIKNNDISRIEE